MGGQDAFERRLDAAVAVVNNQSFSLHNISQCNAPAGGTLSGGVYTAIGYIIFAIGCVTYALGPIIQKWAMGPVLDETDEEMVERGTDGSRGSSNTALGETEGKEAAADGDKDAEEESTEITFKPARPWLYLGGVVMYLGSGALWTIAIIFAPIQQLSPLLAISVILNFLFAKFLLGTTIRKRDAYGTIPLFTVAVILMAFYAPPGDRVNALAGGAPGGATGNEVANVIMEGINDLETSAAFLAWTFGIVGVLVALASTAFHLEHVSKGRALGGIEKVLLPFCYGTAAGICGGLTTPIMQLLQSIFKIAGETQSKIAFEDPTLYLCILFFAVFEIGQVYFVGKGIANFSTAFITTLEVIFNGITSGLTGTIAFKGFNCFTQGVVPPTLYAIAFLLEFAATGITVSGIIKNTADEEAAAAEAAKVGGGVTPVPDGPGSARPTAVGGDELESARSSSAAHALSERISASGVRRPTRRNTATEKTQHPMAHMTRTPSMLALPVHAVVSKKKAAPAVARASSSYKGGGASESV